MSSLPSEKVVYPPAFQRGIEERDVGVVDLPGYPATGSKTEGIQKWTSYIETPAKTATFYGGWETRILDDWSETLRTYHQIQMQLTKSHLSRFVHPKISYHSSTASERYLERLLTIYSKPETERTSENLMSAVQITQNVIAAQNALKASKRRRDVIYRLVDLLVDVGPILFASLTFLLVMLLSAFVATGRAVYAVPTFVGIIGSVLTMILFANMRKMRGRR